MPFKFNPFTDKLDLTQSGGGGPGSVEFLTGNTGGPIGPDGANNINIIGGTGINVAGSGHTLTVTTAAAVFPVVQAQVSAVAILNLTGDGTVYTVIFDTPIVNIGSNYNTSTGIFTAPTTGTYFLGASVCLYQVTTSTFAQLNLGRIGVNNQLFLFNPLAIVTSNTQVSLAASCVQFMNANDQLQVTIQVSGGAGTKTVGITGNNNGATSWITIFQVS